MLNQVFDAGVFRIPGFALRPATEREDLPPSHRGGDTHARWRENAGTRIAANFPAIVYSCNRVSHVSRVSR